MLKKLDENLWTAAGTVRIMGHSAGTRMTVVKLPSQGLWIHSPIRLSEGLRGELKSLGPVANVVCPNNFHHLFIRRYVETYSDAVFHAVPAVAKKRREVTAFEALTPDCRSPWAPELDMEVVSGRFGFREAVFFHAPSRTLILTDLAFNVRTADSPIVQVLLQVYGVYGQFAPSRLVRFLLGRGRRVRRSLERISSWPFQRIILAHGEPLEGVGPEILKDAFGSLVPR